MCETFRRINKTRSRSKPNKMSSTYPLKFKLDVNNFLNEQFRIYICNNESLLMRQVMTFYKIL